MTKTMLVVLVLAGCSPDARWQPEPRQNAAIVAADGLTGTNWTVTAINGRATPGGPGYFLSFTDSEMSVRFGCNSIVGGYQVNGDHLSTNELVQTEMACPGPDEAFEGLGTGVLASNMRIERVGGEAFRLISEAGSIELRRAR